MDRENGITVIKIGGAPNFMPYLMSFLLLATLAAMGMDGKQVDLRALGVAGAAGAAVVFSVFTMLASPRLILSKQVLAIGKSPRDRRMRLVIPLTDVAKVWDEDTDAEGTLSYVWLESMSGDRTRLPVPLRGVEETSYIIAQIQKAMAEARKGQALPPSVSRSPL